MVHKWLNFVLLIIIIYLLRCYWLPIFNNRDNNDKTSRSNTSENLVYNDSLNYKLDWNNSKGVMPFIGSLDYQVSRKFYSDIGFRVDEGEEYCRVHINEELSFWLQNYFNKQWIDNSMVFLDVPNLVHLKSKLRSLKIEDNYSNVKISETKLYDWGNEFFMHDPSGVLWHFCEYNKVE